ncbi:MAG: hypothetical protein V2B15_12610 [Bacteroidota bacterium]
MKNKLGICLLSCGLVLAACSHTPASKVSIHYNSRSPTLSYGAGRLTSQLAASGFLVSEEALGTKAGPDQSRELSGGHTFQ